MASVGFKHPFHFDFSNSEYQFQSPAAFSFDSIHKHSGISSGNVYIKVKSSLLILHGNSVRDFK
jgi:hypothetical protein